MTIETAIMPATTFDHAFVYASACRQFPKVSSPEIGTTENSISAATGNRIQTGNRFRKS